MKAKPKGSSRRSFFDSWPKEALACLDYLRGVVAGDEYEAACWYEYARESSTLRDAAAGRDSAESAALWAVQYPWVLIRSCPSFPGKPWNQIKPSNRADILRAFDSKEIQPLHMTEAMLLDAQGVFDEFKSMAAVARAKLTRPGPRQKAYPLLTNGRLFHALFTLDTTKTITRLLQEFDAWLNLPQNRNRFSKPENNPTGKTGVFKDRLKDLSAWRLLDELGFKRMQSFIEAESNRGGRPFHDARYGQSDKVNQLHKAPLYREEGTALKAKERAKGYLAKLIPWEFGDYAAQEERFVSDWCKKLPSISKRTS